MSVVTISYDSLVSNVDLSVDVLKAYGSDGYGVLTISDIPRYKELRERLLPLSHKLAHLPQETLSKYEDEISLWNTGWSYGKEKLGDVPDLAKGSYYANPIYDEATTEEDRKIHPTFYPKNIWPTDDLPELEVAFKELGKVMYDTSVLLSRQIDLVVSRIIPGYEKNLLNREIGKTKKIKGRLLYYYPTESTDTDDGWIGWHNDSGFLTALTAAMFFDDTTGEIIPNPDPTGGLWIVDRGHSPIKAVIPPNNLAIQCGECLQIVTGGVFVATPHCVKASKAPIGKKVGRGTFPVFIDTGMDFLLSAPKGTNRESVFDKTVHSKVPPLQNRWTHDGQPFQQFLHETFERYYNWNFM